jgi:hypothetical protein
MIVFEHPITAYIILVTATNAEHLTFISNQCSAEFRNQEIIVQQYFIAGTFINIVEMNVLGAPFKVMHIFSRTVALL